MKMQGLVPHLKALIFLSRETDFQGRDSTLRVYYTLYKNGILGLTSGLWVILTVLKEVNK